MKTLESKFRYKHYELVGLLYGFPLMIEAFIKNNHYKAMMSLDLESYPSQISTDMASFFTVFAIIFLVLDVILTTTRNDTRYVTMAWKIWLRCASLFVLIAMFVIKTWDWPIFIAPTIMFIRPVLNWIVVSRSIDKAEKRANGII